MAELDKVIKGLECHADRTNLSCNIVKCPYFELNFCGVRLAQDALELLKEQEAVVRCKDCRHWLPMDRFHQDYHPGRGDCELNCWVRDFDWFCADGERKVGEVNNN